MDVIAECPIDVCLVSATVTGMGLEPGDDVCVEPQRDLLFNGPVEDAAPGVRPVEDLRSVARVDLIVGQASNARI